MQRERGRESLSFNARAFRAGQTLGARRIDLAAGLLEIVISGGVSIVLEGPAATAGVWIGSCARRSTRMHDLPLRVSGIGLSAAGGVIVQRQPSERSTP
jgi:hypothetical protein